jgi:hypothetical protein
MHCDVIGVCAFDLVLRINLASENQAENRRNSKGNCRS